MSVVDILKLNSFVDSHVPENYLNQLQSFLEQCYQNNSFKAHLEEFILELSFFLKTDVSSIRQQFKKVVSEYWVGLVELGNQICSQTNLLSFILKSFPPEQELVDIDSEVFSTHYNCFVDSIIEYIYYLSEYVDIGWVYSPPQMQKFIIHISEVNNAIFPEVLSSDILKQYEDSKSSLKLSISNACNNYYGSPLIPFPSYDSLDSHDSSEISVSSESSPLFDTMYDLSAILDKIVQNHRHDAVKRGEPVGQEFW